MKKLLYITNGICGSGGLERVLSVKASMLADDFEYDVHILSLNEPDKVPFFPFSGKIEFHSVQVYGNPSRYLLRYIKGIKKVADQIKPDVISVCDDGLKGFFIPKILGKKVPVIYERHASLILNNSPFSARMMKFLAADFDRFVVLTKGNLKEWPGGNTKVIGNPVSFYPLKPAGLFAKKVIAVGSHSRNKGYDRLLEVWQKVSGEFPDWTLEIYGKSTDDTFQNLAEKMKLQKVNFHKPFPAIEEKYLQSSVFALPSRSEGFGMVLIEAMSCGLPVVSFDCPHGPADIITNGEDGFLIENGNTQAFAEKLTLLMNSLQMRTEMGTVGRENAKKYLPLPIAAQWDRLFRSLM